MTSKSISWQHWKELKVTLVEIALSDIEKKRGKGYQKNIICYQDVMHKYFIFWYIIQKINLLDSLIKAERYFFENANFIFLEFSYFFLFAIKLHRGLNTHNLYIWSHIKIHTYWRTNVTQFCNIQKRDLNEIVSALKLTGIVDSLILFFFACFQQRKKKCHLAHFDV